MLEQVRGRLGWSGIAGIAVLVASVITAGVYVVALSGGDGPTEAASAAPAATSSPAPSSGGPAAAPSQPSPPRPPAPTAEPTHLPRVDRPERGRVTALLLGLDRRPPPQEDPNGPNRSDVIELVTFDPATGKAALVGFPRDTLIAIPSAGQNRINTAYFWGVYATGSTDGGLERAKETVESVFRVKVDFVIAVDFQAYVDLADDIGGVWREIPAALDNYWVSAPFTGPDIRLRAGRQVATGEYLLAAARARPDGDLRRIERAQSILTGLFTSLRSMNLFQLTSIFLTHADAIETTLNPSQWPALIELASRVDPAKIEYYSIGPFTSGYTTPEGAAVLLPSMGPINEMLDTIFGVDRLQ